MASINKVILIGNLGKDPDIRVTQNGTTIATLALATSRRYKDTEGNVQEETEWHRVVLFGRAAEVAREYLRKGNPMYVEGRLRTHKFTDKEGIERYQTEIVGEMMQLLGTQRAAQSASTSAPAPAHQAQTAAAPVRATAPEQKPHGIGTAHGINTSSTLSDEDIPF